MPDVILLAAPTGAGKTTACHYFAEMARAEGLAVGGILGYGRYDAAGHKIGIDAIDLMTGEQHPLDVPGDGETLHPGRFCLNPLAMEWALQVMIHALSTPLDAVVIDEFGQSGMDRKTGFAAVLHNLGSAKASHVILAVRTEHQPSLRASLIHLHPTTTLLTPRNRDLMPKRMLSQVRNGVYTYNITANTLLQQAARSGA
jgi:nucleoside-triphosphatase THEP1